MKAGSENEEKIFGLPRRAGLALLGLFMAIAAYMFYDNVLATPSYTSQTPAAGRRNSELDNATAAASSAQASQSSQPKPLVKRLSKGDQFRPVLHKKGPRTDEEQINPADIDPTLHLELLAKVQNMKLEGGQRNLFLFGAPPAAEVKLPVGEEPKIAMGKPYIFPKPDPPKVTPPPPAAPPPPPPPSFKYYGLATKRIDNKKTAFFLDGEEIILATEGMTVKGKWRVVRIGADSVMLEDAQTKKQQPLAISEEAGGSE